MSVIKFFNIFYNNDNNNKITFAHAQKYKFENKQTNKRINNNNNNFIIM